jgi:WD40 repeat protein
MSNSVGGKVYFWDRNTGIRLHEMSTEPEAGLAHAVWNHASSECLILATATDDGDICLWSAPLPVTNGSRT